VLQCLRRAQAAVQGAGYADHDTGCAAAGPTRIVQLIADDREVGECGLQNVTLELRIAAEHERQDRRREQQ
jgi:hypothetical protein